MKKPILYKYINLLLRFTIGVVAVWYIYKKIKATFINNVDYNQIIEVNWVLILATILLLFINWGIEALKWRFTIRTTQQVTFFKALQLIFTGITIGLLTPNRIGEIPARALLLNKNKFKNIVLKTTVASFSQAVITFLLGGLGLIFTQAYFQLGWNKYALNTLVLIALTLLMFLYFSINKWTPIFNRFKILKNQELIKALISIEVTDLFLLLIFSFVRYLVFFLQYWLLLFALGIRLTNFSEILLIPVCFLLASSIPTILISEIGVRGSVALFVFGAVSDLDIQIMMAAVMLWLINVALPALIGLFNLKELKLLKEE